MVTRWLPQLAAAPSACAQLVDFLVHLTLQQFRTDVIANIKHDLKDEATLAAI